MGSRGASSTLKNKTAQTQTQTLEEKFPIPNNITAKQKSRLENIRASVTGALHSEKYKDNYEITKFDVKTTDYGTASVIINVNRKGGSALTQDTAIIYIGKNGGMKHFAGTKRKLKTTKWLSQAFYDYSRSS